MISISKSEVWIYTERTLEDYERLCAIDFKRRAVNRFPTRDVYDPEKFTDELVVTKIGVERDEEDTD